METNKLTKEEQLERLKKSQAKLLLQYKEEEFGGNPNWKIMRVWQMELEQFRKQINSLKGEIPKLND